MQKRRKNQVRRGYRETEDELEGEAKYMVRIQADRRFYHYPHRTKEGAEKEVKLWGEMALYPFEYQIFVLVERGEYY